MSDVKPLLAQHVLEFGYTRSLGPTLTAFFKGLADRKIVGAKTTVGRVIVPPTPHDPDTGEDIAGLVDLPDTERSRRGRGCTRHATTTHCSTRSRSR